MVVLAGPMFSGGSGTKHMLNYYDPDEAFPSYRQDLDEMDEYVQALKERGTLYAKEAEEFVSHLRNIIRNQAIHEELHKALWPVMKTAKKLLAMQPFDESGKMNPEFQNDVLLLENQVKGISKHRNTRLLLGSIFALLTAATIAAAITIAVLIPGAQIFAPLLLGIAALKPAFCAGITYSDAYQAHGLLKRVNPMITAMKQEVPRVALTKY